MCNRDHSLDMSVQAPPKKNNMSKQEKMKLENHIKKQRIIVGSIVEISIDDKYYVYAQILKNGSYAFFDFRSEKQLQDYSILT